MAVVKFIPIYCEEARKREMERVPMGSEWGRRQSRALGQSRAEKVDGEWRCACCKKSVRVVC